MNVVFFRVKGVGKKSFIINYLKRQVKEIFMQDLIVEYKIIYFYIKIVK